MIKMSAEQEPKIGEELGRFKLLALLGRGASGDVYKAHDALMDREVALKILHKHELADPIARARFEREGVIVSSLSHENIVQFFAVGISKSGYPYIAMELLEGKTLREVLDSEGSLNIERAIDIVSKVTEAIQYAFDKGILHRDIKPENIVLLESGFGETAKLLDFGLAKNLTSHLDETTLTQTGHLIGSAAYMAPELGKGEKPDHRTDLYAIVSVLFECIAGSQPYTGETPAAVLYRHANEPIPSLSKRARKTITPELESVIKRGLAKDASERFQLASELNTALQKARSSLTRTQEKKKLLLPITALSVLAVAAMLITNMTVHNDKAIQASEKTISPLKLRQLIMASLSDNPAEFPAQSIEQALKQELTPVERGLILRLKARNTKNPSARLYYYIRAFQFMASDEANAPMYCELDCLRNAIQGCGNAGLSNAQNRYLYRYINKLTKWIKDGKPIPGQYKVATIVPYRTNLQNAKLEKILVLLSRGQIAQGRAEFAQMEGGLEYAPGGFVSRIRWKLGEKKLVEDSIYEGRCTPEYLSFMSGFFREKGLNEMAQRCSSQAIEKTKDSVNEEVFQTNILSYIAERRFADAIESIKQRCALDSNNSRSNWREYTRRRSFRIAALEYCGDSAEAEKMLKSFLASKIAEKEDQAILTQFSELLSKAPSAPREQFHYLLKTSLKQNAAPLLQWFAMSHAKNISKTFVLSKDEKLPLWLAEQIIIRQYWLSTREIELCKSILQETKNPKDNSFNAGNIREAAQIRLAELYYTVEDPAKCIRELENIEAASNEAYACNRIYGLELQLKRQKQASRIIDSCTDFKELLHMSRSSIENSEQILGEKCLSKAKSMLGKNVLRQTQFYTEQALAYLEFDQNNKVESATKWIDSMKIRLNLTAFNTTTISDAALAMLIADKRERGDEIIKILQTRDDKN